MSALKQSLRLALIPNEAAARLLSRHHPLGPGHPWKFSHAVYYDGKLEGVLTWGACLVNSATRVFGLRLSDALELRKFWLSDAPPAHSESRVLAVAVRLVRKAYPALAILITYCDGDERASAYKAAGWVPLEAQRYVREVTIGDRTRSLREINRLGGLKRLPPGSYTTTTVCRRKWAYPLRPDIQALVAQLAVRPAPSGEGGGPNPTPTLHTPAAG